MKKPTVTMEDVVAGCAAHYAVPPRLLPSKRHDHLVQSARMLAAWFGVSLARLTFAEVGEALGRGEYHVQTTFRTVEARRRDPAFREMMDAIEIAILAIGLLRVHGIAMRAPVDAREIARRVLSGGDRAAGAVSIHEIQALCRAVLAAEEEPFETAIAPCSEHAHV